MQLGVFFFLTTILFATAEASTVTVAVTGVTGDVYVEAGPMFGYSSYKHIPEGTAFTVIYTFDDARGLETTLESKEHLITQSQIDSAADSAPGTNATLQIGEVTWEFGSSNRSRLTLNTSPGNQREQITFSTPNGGNRVSVDIHPVQGGYWPRNGDWRASFTAPSLAQSSGSFSADNGRVTARGKLLPTALTVNGVNVGEQWLAYTTVSGGPGHATWERQWHLAHASQKGGYVVERVDRSLRGTNANGSAIMPSSITYWIAWPVDPGSSSTGSAKDMLAGVASTGQVGEDSVSATARFYEGLTLPASFAVSAKAYAGSHLFSDVDPHLSTRNATLPVLSEITLRF